MVRRHIALLALAFATFAAACTSPTAPKPSALKVSPQCAVNAGSGVCSK
jgi:hypothetical protein